MQIATLETVSIFVSNTLFGLFFASWAYAIVAVQLVGGFPPFYIHGKRKHQPDGYIHRTFNFTLRRFYFMGVSMFAMLLGLLSSNQTATMLCLFIGALCAFLFGIKHRQFLKAEPNLPYPLIDMMRFRLPIMGEITNCYPMLIFDIWTIGNATLFFLLIVFV
ncbi:MAG: hypothetical protein AAF484_01775 [Pseudomonadota bacterium]